MTYLEVSQILESTNIPCAYDFFKPSEKTAPPYIVYYYLDDNDFHADNINFQPVRELNIELNTAGKDFISEKKVETVLNNNGLSYTRNEQYLEDENINLVTYGVNIVITD